MKYLNTAKALIVLSVLSLASCSEDEVSHLRPSIDYSLATAETPYSELFEDTNGVTTVDLSEGNSRHKMFQALNYYSTSSVSANAHIDAAKLKSLFSNTGNPFTDISTSSISVVGADLNSSNVQLKDKVASSKSSGEADAARARFESLFDQIDAASNSVNVTASQGVAGKLGTYLVDAKGIEIAQIIQKSLIGALQLDYIGNVLLDAGLTADNHSVVGDKNYTQLEHNWDEAYGFLTLNPIYLAGSTNDTRGTVEFGAGSYIWEYNKASYAKIYPAFLKGRVAIVNNDKAEYQAQATFIRTEFEKAIASAALGYLDKWKTGTTDAARAHAIGEGLGFIYSLRFATIHGGDAAFSDDILDGLIDSPNGFWDLTASKINTASDAIKAKFGL
jgi:FlaG/FlaF family flagellin (archaellin)